MAIMNVSILSPQKRWAMKSGVFDPAEMILWIVLWINNLRRGQRPRGEQTQMKEI